MPQERSLPSPSSPENELVWTRAIELDRLSQSGRASVKLGDRQLALFLHDGSVHACNNRCPHEGYPLIEGALDADCKLTCHWHNWKFDLKSGDNHYGGDRLRIYPVKLEDGAVWVDTRDPPAHERARQVMLQLDAAMDEHDTPRIARELARLAKAETPPEAALERAIERSHDRLRYGMTHAYAAAEVWLRLRDTLGDEAQRLACATEALGYIAYESLREPAFVFEQQVRPWNAQSFLAAVEAQDEALAASLLVGALNDGLLFTDLQATLTTAALTHYNDFGHSLIYLGHVRGLVERLGTALQRPLLLAWLRSLVYATREDLLPDFRHYAPALAQWPPRAADVVGGDEPVADPDIAPFVGRSVRDTLAATLAAAAHTTPLQLHHALMQAAALHLLRFDPAVEQRTDNPVADNVGWLDFSHAITFGHALRVVCSRQPELWPQGLLQMAMFVGRNSGYLEADDAGIPALQRWAVADAAAFDTMCTGRVLDHGLALYIHPAHLLKTWAAMRDEIALGVPEATAQALRAAVNRLFGARFKQRHVLRTARQALGFVGKED
jgi:nitrite reductase/ring-hydroxylating ferredoxin subunit